MGDRPTGGAAPARRRALRPALAGLLAGLLVTVAACGSDAPTGPTTTLAPTLTPASALIAITTWEVDRSEPRLDDGGEPILPVVYFTAAAGDTIEIGVQAEVVEATADRAVVRFSDTSVESLDDGLPELPVRDDGVMFVVDTLPVDGSAADVSVARYRSSQDDLLLTLQLRATPDGAEVVDFVERRRDDAD